ncbi:MAG: hypothetical protein LBC35_05685 [Coriobacteriales bacterium]|jgi:hypothetical protein|nr:hypothetical protein [Coriobacteriales bacterium]
MERVGLETLEVLQGVYDGHDANIELDYSLSSFDEESSELMQGFASLNFSAVNFRLVGENTPYADVFHNVKGITSLSVEVGGGIDCEPFANIQGLESLEIKDIAARGSQNTSRSALYNSALYSQIWAMRSCAHLKSISFSTESDDLDALPLDGVGRRKDFQIP